MLHKIIRLYYTVKPLRFEQIYFRLFYKIFPLKSVAENTSMVKASLWKWQGEEFVKSSILDRNHVIFLNQKADISDVIIWNDAEYEKLWLYNLHYFDDLNAIESLSRKTIQYNLVKRWNAENPPVKGNGWEPYPTSLRLVNWIKWYQRAEISDQSVLNSIALQSRALSKQLEYHILGNHLFANAKALVFSGCFLQGKESVGYLDLGLKLLDREIQEQFLADGGHFELSPMYHCILLWDLLDLINLANISGEKKLLDRLSVWKEYASKALNWLNVMTHTDGDIAFFNDATVGIAANPEQIQSYGASLGLKSQKNVFPYQCLKKTGYSRIKFPLYALILDHGEVGSSYLPGHAHADTLSFELSVGECRFFVNSGTSLYGLTEERQRQRGTAAHNTVVINGADSSEVWGGFRVARRAHVSGYSVDINEDNINIAAQHDGYLRFKEGGIHERNIIAGPEKIVVKDEVSGNFNHAVAYFHLHPEIHIEVVSDYILILTSKNNMSIQLESSSLIIIETSTYHPGFGVSIPNKRLSISLQDCEQLENIGRTLGGEKSGRSKVSLFFKGVNES